MRQRYKIVIAVMFAVILFVVSFILLNKLFTKNQHQEIKQLFLIENGQYVPYYILDKTDDYYLLIRKNVIGPHPFCFESAEVSSYYNNSAIDVYLTTDFLNSFPKDIQDYFIVSEITITSKNSIGICGKEVERIKRKIFIPSYSEVTGRSTSVLLNEGKLFSKDFLKEYGVANNEKDEPSAWWLRTPDTWYYNRVVGVNEEEGIGVGSTIDDVEIYQNYVRPVIKVSSKIPIEIDNDQWKAVIK